MHGKQGIRTSVGDITRFQAGPVRSPCELASKAEGSGRWAVGSSELEAQSFAISMQTYCQPLGNSRCDPNTSVDLHVS
jgi:hypothetical protein